MFEVYIVIFTSQVSILLCLMLILSIFVVVIKVYILADTCCLPFNLLKSFSLPIHYIFTVVEHQKWVLVFSLVPLNWCSGKTKGQ